MKRLTRARLDGIRKSYHMDLKDKDAYRVGGDGTAYAKNMNVERLVAEVEACWMERKRERRRLRERLKESRELEEKLKACQETMMSLSGKLGELRRQVEKERGVVGCQVCPYKESKPCWHCEGCSYR